VNARLGKREWDEREFFAHYSHLMFDPERAKERVAHETMKRDETFQLDALRARVDELTRDKERDTTRIVEAKLAGAVELRAAAASHRAHCARRTTTTTVALTVTVVVMIGAAIGAYALGAVRERRRVDADADADAEHD
jgi:hypothetical protein